ncbi:methyltransferase like 4 [Lycorma delicatula]|uniref:methyltransferase like 4 n=1 Tax=Lycorma delicatula TaxID=130591 RepID=UPI003F514895
MSILYFGKNGCIISHERYIDYIYKETKGSTEFYSFSLKSDLFNIVSPYLRDVQLHNHHCLKNLHCSRNKKKRKKNNSEVNLTYHEVKFIKSIFHEVTANEIVKTKLFSLDSVIDVTNNVEARSASKSHFENISKDSIVQVFNGKNENSTAIIVVIDNKTYIIPAMCQFFNCNILDLPSKISEDIKFDFILLDPPWWNKYIRRKRKKKEEEGYKMMYDKEISSIPLQRLLEKDGLVAVWCTNSPSHLKALTDDIFPSWSIKYVSTWFWIKVTKKGETVCEFSDPPGKQPYERIVFACATERSKSYKNPEDKKIIISIPSAIHSHKPPLSELMNGYLNDTPKCLELFARYLLPGWTSCGDQVLSLQNISLYNMKISTP